MIRRDVHTVAEGRCESFCLLHRKRRKAVLAGTDQDSQGERRAQSHGLGSGPATLSTCLTHTAPLPASKLRPETEVQQSRSSGVYETQQGVGFQTATRVSGIYFKSLFFVFIFKWKGLSLFVYFESETAREGEGQRERERENPQQALHCEHRARCGARTHKTVRSRLEPKARVGRLTD